MFWLNKLVLIAVFLVGLWFTGFWMGTSCQDHTKTCYVPIVWNMLK